jgi:hypothetical protein
MLNNASEILVKYINLAAAAAKKPNWKVKYSLCWPFPIFLNKKSFADSKKKVKYINNEVLFRNLCIQCI